ncbi:hypothetical protein [Terriglobus roseus]|uniref:Uncharacterized protein n=1 Tax=Terriglobus roseus TaxID=392734 RepID=A0A1H4NSC0_9BACT|nr:hypothetical protein [Terriglobus roseus]SEB98019.1 hypothetical protein SAMN05443244_2338 [Terriglobus roseus]
MAQKIVFSADTAQFSQPVQKSAGEVRALGAELKKVEQNAKTAFREAQVAAKAAGASSEDLRKIEQAYYREILAIRQARKQVDAEHVAGSKDVVGAEEAKRRATDTVTEALKRQRAEVERRLPSGPREQHYTPSRQQQASAILRGGGLRAGESFASMIPGFSQFAEIAFPVAGAAALTAEVLRGEEALRKEYTTAIKASEAIRGAYAEQHASAQVTVDELAVEADKLQDNIDKLNGHPGNGLKTALDEARVYADKLQQSLFADRKELESLLKEHQVSGFASLLSGVAGTKGQSDQILEDHKKVEAQIDAANSTFNSDSANAKSLEDIKKAGERRDKAIRDALQATISTYKTESKRLAAEQAQSEKDAYDATIGGGAAGSVVDNSAKIANIDVATGKYKDWLNKYNGQTAVSSLTEKDNAGKGAKERDTLAREGARRALEAQKKAEEEQRKQWDEDLKSAEQNGKLTAAQEKQLWIDKENTVKRGSANYLYAQGKELDASKKDADEQKKRAEESLKWQIDLDKQQRAALTNGPIVRVNDEYAKGQAAAAASGRLLQEQSEDAARSIALSTVQWQLQAHYISKADAAVMTQTLHTMQYEAAVKRLADQYEAIQNGPNADEQRNAVRSKVVDLETRRSAEVMQDQAAVAGQTWSGALKQANAEWVQNSLDTAKQVSSIYSGVMDGLNADLETYFQNVGRRGVHHAGRDLGNAVGGTLRNVGGQIAETGLKRAEAGVLSAFGLGGGTKPDGTKDNKFWVQFDSPMAGMSTNPGNVFSGDLAKELGFGSDDSSDGTSSQSSFGAKLLGSVIGTLVGGLFGGGKAIGGNVSLGKTYLVGENGPEYFSPGATGYITPNDRIGAGGGPTNHMAFTVDARGAHDPAAVQAAVQRGITDAAPHIVAATLAAATDRRARLPSSKAGSL